MSDAVADSMTQPVLLFAACLRCDAWTTLSLVDMYVDSDGTALVGMSFSSVSARASVDILSSVSTRPAAV